MQQHTGQHILSAAFDHLCGARTVSFHLGSEAATIDLSREVSVAEIARAETEANRIVWEDRPVAIRFVSEAEAAALPLRKEPARTGTLRLIDVPDFDLSACGGTHVARTGAIGIIAVAAWERFKGGSRVTFVCGGRALASHRALRDVVTQAMRQLSVARHEIGDAVERLQADLKSQQRVVSQYQEQVSVHLAAELRTTAKDVGSLRVVLREQPGWDQAALKMLALAIVAEPGYVVVLVGEGTPRPVVVARSRDVGFDCGAWIKSATTALGGRGGGRPESAQGGMPATVDAVFAEFERTAV
jgi:alanyl-tRNA synthetase